MRGSASASTCSSGSMRRVVYWISASSRLDGMRASTSQSPDSYMRRVKRKSHESGLGIGDPGFGEAKGVLERGASARPAAPVSIKRRKSERFIGKANLRYGIGDGR